MAVRPKRKNPISTRPIYLPKVPAKELREAGRAGVPAGRARLRIHVDGAPRDLDIGRLAQRLSQAKAAPAVVQGELVSALTGRPHSEVRDAVAALANRLAWARIRDPAKREYRVLPLRGEVDEEEARFRARSQPEYEGLRTPSAPAQVLHDGAQVQAAYRDLLSLDAGGGEATHIVITDRRLGRWNSRAKRWTPVTVVAGVPVLVSVGSGEGGIDSGALVSEIRRAL